MENSRFSRIPFRTLPSPCFVVDLGALRQNLDRLDEVQRRTGCKILLALKAFSMFSTFPLIRQFLHGVCASSLHEARLGREEFGREVHVFSPAYPDADLQELLLYADYFSFNSFSQWQKHKAKVLAAGKSCGIRINPQYSEVEVDLYNPCARFSRLGVTLKNFEGQDLAGITGLHFHAMCEQNSDTLARIAKVVHEKFGSYLKVMKWANLGGGHHITREDYDLDTLCRVIEEFQQKYGLQVYVEPGEAVALNSGVLVATVLDLLDNEMPLAILDTSAETHMPDVLAMPYRPKIIGAGEPGEYPYTYRLGGMTCLAGDCIGNYSFPHPLKVGDQLVFLDMAHYSMVKTTTFNGVNLPAIATYDPSTNQTTLVRRFGYEDFKSRL